MATITYEGRTEKKLKKQQSPKKRKFKKIVLFLGLFLLFFIASFVIINWQAVKFQADYRINGVGKGQDEQQKEAAFVVQEFEQAKEKYYEGEDRLIIPKIQVEAPLKYADSFNERHIQELLKDGLVHYVNTARAGDDGNMVIVGHSSSYQWDKNSYGRVFALLNELETGDHIFFIKDHKQYRYTITEKFIIKANQVEVLEQEGFDQPTVTLMSCWPIGTYWKRLIVRGELNQY